MPQENNIHTLNETLFNIAKCNPSDKTLSEAKDIIKNIPIFNGLIKKQNRIIKKLRESHPDLEFKLLKQISIDMQNESGETVLMLAAKQRNIPLLHLLIASKANVNISNNCNYTALDAIIIRSRNGIDYTEVMQQLINAKADVNFHTNDPFSALSLAASIGNCDLLQILIQSKANLEAKIALELTALDLTYNRMGVDLNEQLSKINLLLKAGAIIHRPAALFEYILETDQRNPEIISILEILCQQHKKSRQKTNTSSEQLSDHQYRSVKSYLQKLKQLEVFRIKTDKHRKAIFSAIDESTNMPTVLTEIITPYYYPSLSGLTLFKPTDVDRILIENSLALPKKHIHDNYLTDFIQRSKHSKVNP